MKTSKEMKTKRQRPKPYDFFAVSWLVSREPMHDRRLPPWPAASTAHGRPPHPDDHATAR
jgi:hypothetical protein